MFCVKCGKQLEEGTFFCPDCGTPLHNHDNSKQQVAKQQTGSKNKTVAIVIAVVIIICLCIANSSRTSGNTTTASSGTSGNAATVKPINAEPVIGKWTDEKAEVVLHLYKDHTGELVSGGWAVKCSWKYNDSNQVLTLEFDILNQPGKVTYNPVKDTLILSEGSTLFRAD